MATEDSRKGSENEQNSKDEAKDEKNNEEIEDNDKKNVESLTECRKMERKYTRIIKTRLL